MTRRAPIIAAIVGAAVLGLVILFAVSPQGGNDKASRKLLGKLAPAVEGSTLSGETFDLDHLRGEWVLVNFFASWCAPCVHEHPELKTLSKDDGGKLQVVSIAFDDAAEDVKAFFATNGGSWPVLIPDSSELSIDYGVTGLPESFLVSPSGKVAAKFEGGVKAKEIIKYVDVLARSSVKADSPDREGGS